MSTPEPEYGIKTCGKLLEKPFDVLGPCLLEPGHEERGEAKCMVQAPGIKGGLLNVQQVDGPAPKLEDHPWFSDEEVLKYRRKSRNLFRGSMAAFGLNVAVLVYNVLTLFDVM